ncbi:MAG: hypothetical protein KGS60_18315 [Verrucomicrobia bacterium]|nr:hypothetical protein [Verrucomicrobiota bacterium]
MLFGRKKKEDSVGAIPGPEEKPETPAPVFAEPVAPVLAEPVAPVLAEPVAPVFAEPVAPVPPVFPVPAGPPGVTVTPDYADARVIAANHIIVNAGQEKLVLDIARELSGGTEKRMPVDTRVVMTVATARRLEAALAQALAKVG